MHHGAYWAVQSFRPAVVRHVYEVGSLIINGSVRPLFHDATTYHGIDAVEGPGVDAVGDGATYEPPQTPDCVLCLEVLEHAWQPQAVVRQLATVCGLGGKVIVTCAGPGRLPHSAVDGLQIRPGEYYRNVDPQALKQWMVEAGLHHVDVMQAFGAPAAHGGQMDLAGDLYAVGYK